ncbi:hypothetical protein J1614_002902 [Plenodomus biglobosus]|nr:hypothetical protein J1614_002902 [Plenodomus biglobosus]
MNASATISVVQARQQAKAKSRQHDMDSVLSEASVDNLSSENYARSRRKICTSTSADISVRPSNMLRFELGPKCGGHLQVLVSMKTTVAGYLVEYWYVVIAGLRMELPAAAAWTWLLATQAVFVNDKIGMNMASSKTTPSREVEMAILSHCGFPVGFMAAAQESSTPQSPKTIKPFNFEANTTEHMLPP